MLAIHWHCVSVCIGLIELAGVCDDTGMYRTVKSAYPTYRERESAQIDQGVDSIAHDSGTRFHTCLGLKRPE